MARRRMLAPINSLKHFVPTTNQAIASGAIVNVLVANSIVAPATTATNSVEEGSVVKAIHLEYWLTGNELSGNTTQFVLTVEKKPAGATSMTNAQALNLQSYLNKKNILYTTQGVLGSSIDGQSVPVIRDWQLIPKGKQRMGLGDQLVVNIAAVGKLRVCGIAIYKELR